LPDALCYDRPHVDHASKLPLFSNMRARCAGVGARVGFCRASQSACVDRV